MWNFYKSLYILQGKYLNNYHHYDLTFDKLLLILRVLLLRRNFIKIEADFRQIVII